MARKKALTGELDENVCIVVHARICNDVATYLLHGKSSYQSINQPIHIYTYNVCSSVNKYQWSILPKMGVNKEMVTLVKIYISRVPIGRLKDQGKRTGCMAVVRMA